MSQRKELAARDSDLETERRQHRETVATNKAMSATAAQTREHVTDLTAQCTALQVRALVEPGPG
jgi:hypothetical protein